MLSPLGLTAATSITDAAIQKKNFGSGTISNSCKWRNGRYLNQLKSKDYW